MKLRHKGRICCVGNSAPKKTPWRKTVKRRIEQRQYFWPFLPFQLSTILFRTAFSSWCLFRDVEGVFVLYRWTFKNTRTTTERTRSLEEALPARTREKKPSPCCFRLPLSRSLSIVFRRIFFLECNFTSSHRSPSMFCVFVLQQLSARTFVLRRSLSPTTLLNEIHTPPRCPATPI